MPIPEVVTAFIQPVVELSTMQVVGYELLSRFEHGTPEEVFAQARAEGSLPELCHKIIDGGLALIGRLPVGMFLSVNVTIELLESIDAERSHIGDIPAVDRARLVMEVSEHSPGELEKVYDLLVVYRQHGVRLAVDDVGSKYGNLFRVMQTLPDFLKIDQVLIENLDTVIVNRAGIRAIVSLAQELRSLVIAEGIETQSELEWCKRLGVRYGQGFLLGRPLPVDEYLPVAEGAEAVLASETKEVL